MNAYLIETVKDLKNLNLDSNDIILCHNITTFYKTNKNKKYFFSIKFGKKKKFFNELFSNWYYSNKGIPKYNYRSYSLPAILNRSSMFSFLNDLKNYIYLNYWLKKYSKVYISKNSCPSILRIKPYFKNLLFFNEKINNCDIEIIPSTPERKHYSFQKKNNLKYFLNFIDKIKNIKSGRILGFKDTKHNEAFKKNKNILILNNKNFFKGFYINDKISYKKFLPQKIKNFKQTSLVKIIKKNFPNDYKNISEIFIKNFNNHLYENRKTIEKTILALEDVTKTYRPRSIIVNGTVDWFNTILIFLSKKFQIKTYLLLEGFHLFKDRKDIPKYNKKFLIDFYVSYGLAHKKIYLSHNINEKKILNIDNIFLKKKFNKNKQQKYDACILCYNTWLFNLNATWDKQILTELEILRIFQKLGLKKILIKKKLSSKSKSQTEFRSTKLYQFLFEKIYNEKLNLSLYVNNDVMNEVVESTKIIVGGISTAIFEANKITDYYIYEPDRNGYSNEEFKTITSFNQKYINKTPLQLINSIRNEKFVKLKFDSMKYTTSFSEIFKN